MRKNIAMLMIAFVAAFPMLAPANQNLNEAVSYIEGYVGTCSAYENNGGSAYFQLTEFKHISGSIFVGVRLKVKDGRFVKTFQKIDLSQLDPEPVFENLLTIPILKFRCSSGSCVENLEGGGDRVVGHLIIPGCSGKEKLANAFKELITLSGGKKSRY